MRILHLTKKYWPFTGGDASVVENLKREQEKAGNEVFIATCETKGSPVDERVFLVKPAVSTVEMDSFGLKRVLGLAYLFFKSFFWLAKAKPDVIHSHSCDMGFAVSFAARLRGVSMVQTLHGVTALHEGKPLVKFFEKFCLIFSGFKKVLAVDRRGLAWLEKNGFAAAYTPNGVNPVAFERDYSKGVSVLFVGRLERQKGADVLVEAAKKFGFPLRVVGEGNELERLKREAKGASVVFLGKLSKKELGREFEKACAFALPSRWEGQPVTILEAWNYGLPVVTTPVGDAEFLQRETSALSIVPVGDADSLGREVVSLLKSPAKRKALGTRGRRAVLKTFNSKNSAKIVFKEYEKAVYAK